MTLFLALVWLAIAALIVSTKPLRARRDCWWLALLWPCALAGAAAILFYELALYKPAVRLLRLQPKGLDL